MIPIMSLNFSLSSTAALLSTALAVSVAFRPRRTAASLFFFAGMLLLGAESILQGISLEALTANRIEYWQSATLILKSLLLGVWFCFSLTYSRGDYSRFLKRASLLLLGFLLPIGVAMWFRADPDPILLDCSGRRLPGRDRRPARSRRRPRSRTGASGPRRGSYHPA